MGDPSAVINQMLRYPENRLFAEHLVDYLVEDDTWGTRKGNLYMVVNDFSMHARQGEAWSPQALAGRLRETGLSLIQWRLPEFVAWIIGIAVSLVIGREAWRRLAQRADIYHPRFAMPAPLVSQQGEAGRAAVLGAPNTPRSLVLLELMSAITAYLAERLGNGENVAMVRVFDAAFEQQLLNQTQRRELSKLVTLVERVQSAFARGGQSQVRLQELRRAHALMLDIVRTIEHRQLP